MLGYGKEIAEGVARRWDLLGSVASKGRARGTPNIVLVHGLGLSQRYIMPLARQLPRDCHVYVPDQPGFGGSGHPEHVPDIAGLTDALADWMRMTGLLRATLVGNSQSCQIIAQLAVHHPDLVATAVLQGPTAPPGERNWFWAGGSLAPDSTLLADGAGGWRSDWCGERPWRRRS